MLRAYEDKLTRAPARAHPQRVRHLVDAVEVCEGAHDRNAPCVFRLATIEERAEFRHARVTLP